MATSPGPQVVGLGAAEVGVVLDVLDGLEEGLRSARVVGDDETGRCVEGRAQLGGVEHREATRGAGAEVVDGAAGAERLDGAVDEVGELGEDLATAAGDGRVLGVEGSQDVERGVRVDGRRPRMALLGGGVHGHLAAHPSEVSFLHAQRQCCKSVTFLSRRPVGTRAGCPLAGSVGDVVAGDGLAGVGDGLADPAQVALRDRDVEAVDDGEGRDAARRRAGAEAGLAGGRRQQEVDAGRRAATAGSS